MGRTQVEVPKEKIEAFCRKRHIRKLSLFGSVLRKDFGPDSDVDVLVEFEKGHVPGFIGLYEMEEEFSEILGGRKIDLLTEKFLNRRMRAHVLAEAEVEYVR